ncbi:MAG: heat-shock protein [Legionella sp. 40-6]|nr:Hsp20/alpha crystallin family protein [Legionella sp.]OJX98198.1 MAG: heat-shock protein [Legionella sp. 40-6]
MATVRKTYYPLHNPVGTFLDNLFNLQQEEDASFVDTGSWAPPVDIKEEADRFLVIADVPGVKKEDIQISLEQHILTLKGERYFEKTEQKNNFTRRERGQGQFYRRFSLPQTADDEKITAKYTHGVLEIIIPKKDVATEKRINIQVDE